MRRYVFRAGECAGHSSNNTFRQDVKRLYILFLLAAFALAGMAQITGKIVDTDGYPIPYSSVMYKGHHLASVSDLEGKFSIERHNGWVLTISSVGFRTQTIVVSEKTESNLKIVLKEDAQTLKGVEISSKRGKYSRKDNPAVELMRRVIEAKKKTDLTNHDYYQYNKYQKMTFALNDIQPEELEQGKFKKSPWLLNHVETNRYNNKLTLPVMVEETLTQHIYRKDPRDEKDIIKGNRKEGVNDIIQTGDILNELLKDVFQDVDIYDDNVRLLQYPFPSPIGSTAIAFYRYYIEDTVYVDKDLCYHLQFIPNNQQDFGFRGEIYVLADSTLHVKKCTLTLPKLSDANYVDNLRVEQEYTKLANGEWALTTNDMIAELVVLKQKLMVTRVSRLDEYAFDPLPKHIFKGRAKVVHEADALIRDEGFWKHYRAVELTKGESTIDAFIHGLEQSKKFKWIVLGLRTFVENYMETGTKKHKSYFDFGPLNTLVSQNFVDGFRFRISGRTTAHLNPHWFWEGFYAYGTKSHEHYYKSAVTYSFNKKKNVAWEFPQRTITFECAKDMMSPADKYLTHGKDNMLMSFRAQKVQQMYFYDRQMLSFMWETDWGLNLKASVKAEKDIPVGDLVFKSMPGADINKKEGMLMNTSAPALIRSIRTTELSATISYRPGQTYVNTKQNRWPVNLDAPEFKLTHTMAVKGFLGGDYRMNYTEFSAYKRLWLGTWGYLDSRVYAGIEWNKVPFPMLIMPPVNVTFVEAEQKQTFCLMRNMEFLSDRYVFCSLWWNLNGKIMNRIPLIKRLKWREHISVKGMWGWLTDKNNPMLPQNQCDNTLFQFPHVSHKMGTEPYLEVSFGFHNIFKVLGVDYVRRINYNGLPHTQANGIRFSLMAKF